MRKMGSMGVMGDKIAKPAKLAKLAKKATPAKPAKLAKKATPRVAVCFDSFKGCVGAEEASRQVAAALCEAGYEAWALPMADGGEGTARVLTLAGVRQPAVDMALKAGLGNREGTSRARVMEASTFELGRMLARMSGSEGEIRLGVGGSATCDGGMGLLAALGARLRFRGAEVSRPAAKDLANLQEIDLSGVKAPRVRMLVDVRAPLTGAEGCQGAAGRVVGRGAASLRVGGGAVYWLQCRRADGDAGRGRRRGHCGGGQAPGLAA